MTTVMTVRGPVAAGELGVTLFHEHLLNDVRCWWHPPLPDDEEGQRIAEAPVTIAALGRLRLDPFLAKHNCALDDPDLATAELRRFAAAGGGCVVEQTCRGIGRDPAGLLRLSERTGTHIVMGTGYYLAASHPPEVASLSDQGLTERIVADVVEGVGTIRAGIIGEIGVSAGFVPAEQRVLRAAARAQAETGVPLSVHLPGWERLGHRVLDTVAEEGAELAAVVLSHMNPSHRDDGYQRSLGDRGAWLSYDMIGMDYFYADQSAQSPCDEENAAAIAALVRDGYGDRILLSGDTFLKTQLVAYGGYGYAYVPTHFAARLRRHGIADDELRALLVDNPARVFTSAAKGIQA